MTYSSQEQLIKFEDELFNLALLGLLEIEGKALWKEDQMLREQGVYDDFPNLADHEVAKIEKMLRKQERKNKVKVALTHLTPVFSKIAVFFMVFWIGTGTVIFASADIQEALYQLIVEHHEKYTQINPGWELSSLPEGYEAFVSAQADFAPTYIPQGLILTGIEEMRYSINASYQGEDNTEIFLVFRQMEPTENAKIHIDTENAEKVQNIVIGNSEGMLVEKENTVQIIWSVKNKVFSVLTNLEAGTAVEFAKGVLPI